MATTAKPGLEAKQGVVQIASFDYLAHVTLEEYFDRCKKYKQLNDATRSKIVRMKELREEGLLNDPTKEQEMAECMKVTFKLRNYDIFTKALSVRNAMDIYPGLQSFRELRREFERVTGKSVDAFQRHLNCVLKEYAKDQIKRKCYVCTNKYCTEALDIIKEGDKQEARKTAARIIIYSCAQSQRKWSDVIYKVYEQNPNGWINTNRPHPTVVVYGTPFNPGCADLFCEDTRILTSVNFYEAILSCYFLYYIFNIGYPAVDEETFQPFDNVMSIIDGCVPLNIVDSEDEEVAQ